MYALALPADPGKLQVLLSKVFCAQRRSQMSLRARIAAEMVPSSR